MTDPSDLPKNLKNRNWRLRNLYYIQDKDGRKVLFKPNHAQRKFLKDSSGRDIILKARQLGFTTLACILGLDEALFTKDWKVLIIAHTRDDARKIFDSKVKYPYDNLPDSIKQRLTAKNDAAGLLSFEHGASIQVATSGRSGTYQRVHISEFGKICAVYPAKAREIITGTLPAVGKNLVTIESTAEGASGKFFEMCQQARSLMAQGFEDWRFHFYPWLDEPGYVYDPSRVLIDQHHHAYFDQLELDLKRKITLEQRAWWVKEENTLGGDMKRENPSTPEEAFEQAIKGAYFVNQLAFADRAGHIGRFGYDPRFPVNTFWDLGYNDHTTIWMHQFINRRNRFIGYYENSGELIAHYFQFLEQWAKALGGRFGDHYFPHDGDHNTIRGNLMDQVWDDHKVVPIVVGRTQRKLDGIQAARTRFPTCDFDAVGCGLGLKHLRHYRKQWDERLETWKNEPLHDAASHCADAFMTFACGFEEPETFEPNKVSRDQAIREGLAMPLPDEEELENEGDLW